MRMLLALAAQAGCVQAQGEPEDLGFFAADSGPLGFSTPRTDLRAINDAQTPAEPPALIDEAVSSSTLAFAVQLRCQSACNCCLGQAALSRRCAAAMSDSWMCSRLA